MPFEYIIKDGFAERREIGAVQRIALEDFIPAVTTYMPIEMSPLPDNTKYIRMAPGASEDQIQMHLITETPPQRRDIMFEGNTYKISLPYERFWFVVNGQKTFTRGTQSILYNATNWGYLWANHPMVILNDIATWGHMPNVYPESNVCFGMNNVNVQQAFGHYVNSVINTFYTSPFNHDLSYEWPYRNMRLWQEASEANPNAWSTWTGIWEQQKSMTELTNRITFIPTLPDGPGEVVPEIRPTPTFSNIQNWWSQLSDDAKARFRLVLDE